jgi:hypothetical protein
MIHAGTAIALAFLSSDGYDAEVEKRSARKELLGLLQNAYDIELPASSTLSDARERLARHVLLTDLVAGLGGAAPASLASAKVASMPSAVDFCVGLARTWRLRRDVRDSYVTAANRVEQAFSLGKLKLDQDPNRILEVETFLAVERTLLRQIENALLEVADEDLLELAKSRLSRFWADTLPSIQAHWALIASVAEVLLEADRVAKALKKPPSMVPALVQGYAEGDKPWCLLDTYHRHMESRWYNFEPESGDDHLSLEKLIVKARQRYTEVGSRLARHFVTQFYKAKHPIKGLLRQRDIFETQVKPKLGHGKVAYVWVDALRFEMARELCRLLEDDFEVSIQPTIGTIPTITEIGMAALLPNADRSAKVVPLGNGKLGLEIEGTIIKDRKDRVALLKAYAGVSVFDVKLEGLLPKPSKRIRDSIQNAQLVLVTSQEIDELCEQDNITQARRQMDGALNDLRRGVRVLSEVGAKTIIMAADHGHLFAEELSEDMKIDAPGGDTADLHRRVWVGVGGTAEPSYLRTSLTSFGIESSLDVATPWTFACFKSKGGARAYFHGGLSPQELIVPVIVMKPRAQRWVGPSPDIQWSLTPGTSKLTTRFFSVQIAGAGTGLFGLELPKVRVEIQANKKGVSIPVSASYGFEDATGEVSLRPMAADSKKIEPNTVTLMLIEEITQKTIAVYLLDAASGAILVSLDQIEVAISI